MRGPSAYLTGTSGAVRVGRLCVGDLRAWRIVTSPTTNRYTLIGDGAFRRYYRGLVGQTVTAHVTPAPAPAYLGRKQPPTPQPLTFAGVLAELSASTVVIGQGTIVRG